jgi:hypothetical protein
MKRILSLWVLSLLPALGGADQPGSQAPGAGLKWKEVAETRILCLATSTRGLTCARKQAPTKVADSNRGTGPVKSPRTAPPHTKMPSRVPTSRLAVVRRGADRFSDSHERPGRA